MNMRACLSVLAAAALVAGIASAGEEAGVALPERWTESVRAGVTEWSSPPAGALLPLEWVVRVRASTGAAVTVQAQAAPDAPSLLDAQFRVLDRGKAQITVKASGSRMTTDALSARTWSRLEDTSGSVAYGWRFPQVRNLWDERDRREIGAAFDGLVPISGKIVSIRLVLAEGLRQVWVDDRLVAEAALPNPPAAGLKIRFQGAELESQAVGPVPADGPFLPLRLTAWSHARGREPLAEAGERIELVIPKGAAVPLWLPPEGAVDLDLGDSLYRYRLTDGSGPDAGYVNAMSAWPGPFAVDPAVFAFRVPYRPWQNAWLLAWTDADPAAVPRGVFRFFRTHGGYPAATPFEISEAAIKAGRVIRLDRQTAKGRPLYLVRVPLETDGLAGMKDMAGQFLEFELTKPLALFRSYPDPIYYGWHPAGPPSSVHVLGVTLEEAPFDYAVKPGKQGFVFVKPEKPSFDVTVTNRTDGPMKASVALMSRSFDGIEAELAVKPLALEPGAAGVARLEIDTARNGWHELRAVVEAGGITRSNTLSFVRLPEDTRTYGSAVNETRFGIWSLWGHYVPMRAGAYEANEEWLGVMRRLGLRRIGCHGAFLKPESLKKLDFIPKGVHTVGGIAARADISDPKGMELVATSEVAQVRDLYDAVPGQPYYYGGEWHLGREIQYAPWPRYTGDGDRPLTADEKAQADRHVKIFTGIGSEMRKSFPKTPLVLQWGAPLGTIGYMKAGMPKELVDLFGMDAPMFELIPESPVGVGGINQLWTLRQEADRLGWPRLPIAWCEGPFFPTCPGALTEEEQAQYQIRYLLAGLAYGVEVFEAGVVDFDAGNYYGAEHYGAGLFRRLPMACPKPAVAAVATATAMLCGMEYDGVVDLGVPTTFCYAFKHPATGERRYALWRVAGKAVAKLGIEGTKPVLTDSMGNPMPLKAAGSEIAVPVDESPAWLTGAGRVASGRVERPVYREAPGPWTRPVAEFSDKIWKWEQDPGKAVTNRHFAVRRIPDPALRVEFGAAEEGHPDAAAVTLGVQPMDRPMAQRTGLLRAKRSIPLAGVPSALGVWVKGNGSWGRIIYWIEDAKGALWSSTGTKDDWNCDDTHGWSYVSFEGWRYVRFPLPGNAAWDRARTADTVWWGRLGAGDSVIPEPPFKLAGIVLEARNEVPVGGVMTLVKERAFKLAGLVAEYDDKADALPGAVKKQTMTRPLPEWKGPTENPLVRLAETATNEAPVLGRFDEPPHFNDGRRMVIRFPAQPGRTYNLYLSRSPGGEGAELMKADVKDGMTVIGFRPDVPVFLFLTSKGADKKESKPSKPVRLVTRDNFAEK